MLLFIIWYFKVEFLVWPCYDSVTSEFWGHLVFSLLWCPDRKCGTLWICGFEEIWICAFGGNLGMRNWNTGVKRILRMLNWETKHWGWIYWNRWQQNICKTWQTILNAFRYFSHKRNIFVEFKRNCVQSVYKTGTGQLEDHHVLFSVFPRVWCGPLVGGDCMTWLTVIVFALDQVTSVYKRVGYLCICIYL